ncbi:MAG: hypothetical protein JJT81_04650 [Rubellimicrobium sp.]|nr:hypothetical protein [Rubellimicrobium sp.]
MLLDPARLGALLWQSVVDPSAAGRWLIALDLPRAVLWQALVLVTVLSVLLVALTQGALPSGPAGGAAGGPVILSPFSYGIILGASLAVLALGLFVTGLGMGGMGEFNGALVLVIWIEVMAMAARTIVVLVSLVLPMTGGLATLAAVGLLGWVLLNFTNVLHEFGSLWKSAITLVFAVIGISLAITLMVTILGLGAGSGADGGLRNV